MKINPLTCIDFYKADHRSQYPEGTELVYSNLTPRSNKLTNLPCFNDKIVFFGLQYFIKDFLQDTFDEGFFNLPKDQVVKAYKRRMDTSLGVDAIDVSHIEALHDLGYLPIEIRALKEGTKVPMGVPVLTIKNTLPEFFWLVNYLETVMSCYLWHPIVSATTANFYKTILDKYADETSSNEAFTVFQGHDFSYRGQTSNESAAVSGCAHLTSFVGTDTVHAIDFAENYYNANADAELIGCSVPATEHSVMCMGTKEDEIETFRRLIEDVYPSGIVSIVSDTWDFWKVLTEYLPALKDKILARSGGALGDKVVIRPDSGDPVKVIAGYTVDETNFDNIQKIYDKYDGQNGGSLPEVVIYNNQYHLLSGDIDGRVHVGKELSEAEVKGAIECLWDVFGGTVNEKGFKELDPHIGLIYGDSITPERCIAILKALEAKGFASTNVVFGIGSYTYQMCTRDNYGLAVKATAGIVNGEVREIFKDPVTDNGTKKSHRGFLKVVEVDNQLTVIQQVSQEEADEGLLELVFKDGVLVSEVSLEDIRNMLK